MTSCTGRTGAGTGFWVSYVVNDLNPCSLPVSGPSASGPSPEEGGQFAFRLPGEEGKIGSSMDGG